MAKMKNYSRSTIIPKIFRILYPFYYTLISIISLYTLNSIAAEDTAKPLVNAGDAKLLKDTILGLGKMDTLTLILFLVGVVVAVGVWWWWKGKNKEITHRENDKRRMRDQAENKTENQRISDELNDAHDKVEDDRAKGEAGTKPRPSRPKG